MRRLMIMGATGMLGHHLLDAAGQDRRFDVWYTVRDRRALQFVPRSIHSRTLFCDVSNEDQIASAVRQGHDTIINCTGITKALATEPISTIRVNSLAPHLIASAADETGARLIQISTDCVFSGLRGGYREEDAPDPSDLYGRSKLLGEVTGRGHLTVRTSFIGPEIRTRHGLLAWFLAQKGRIGGYTRVFWSGFTSLALSRILLELALRPEVTGLLNVAGERIDKYALLCRLQKAYDKRDVVIEPTEQPVCDRSLDNSRFHDTGIPYPSLDDMIAELETRHGQRPITHK